MKNKNNNNSTTILIKVIHLCAKRFVAIVSYLEALGYGWAERTNHTHLELENIYYDMKNQLHYLQLAINTEQGSIKWSGVGDAQRKFEDIVALILPYQPKRLQKVVKFSYSKKSRTLINYKISNRYIEGYEIESCAFKKFLTDKIVNIKFTQETV